MDYHADEFFMQVFLLCSPVVFVYCSTEEGQLSLCIVDSGLPFFAILSKCSSFNFFGICSSSHNF